MGSELEEYDEIIDDYISFATMLNNWEFMCLHLVLRLRGGAGFADLDMELARMSVMDLSNDDHDQEYTEEHENKGFQLLEAAWSGDEVRATQLLASNPTLMFYSSDDGNTVLHVAALLGNISFVKKLIDFINVHKPEVFSSKSPHLIVNDDKDTALHLALKFEHKEVASDLVKEMPEPKIVYAKNKNDVMPINLAMSAGYMDLVEDMLKRAPWSSFSHHTRQILLHSTIVRDALHVKDLGMLQIVLDNMPALVDSYFAEGTALTYAMMRLHDVDKVRYLLKNFPDTATKCDRHGNFPIYEAIVGNNLHMIKEFASCVPETLYRVDEKGKSILHLVVEFAKPDILSYVRTLPEFHKMLHYKDVDGNTFMDLLKDQMGIYFRIPQGARKEPEHFSLEQQMEEPKSPQAALGHQRPNTKQQMEEFKSGRQAQAARGFTLKRMMRRLGRKFKMACLTTSK